MSTNTNQDSSVSRGIHFVDLFKVDADRFQLLAQTSRCERDCEYLNRPYELGDLMRQAL
jgi:hypothetical protein